MCSLAVCSPHFNHSHKKQKDYVSIKGTLMQYRKFYYNSGPYNAITRQFHIIDLQNS